MYLACRRIAEFSAGLARSFFFGDENDNYNIHLFYDCFRGPIDGSHLYMLSHMMTSATPCMKYSNTLSW